MAKFRPTPAQRKKYAGYTTEIGPDMKRPAMVKVVDGAVIRFAFTFYCIPSEKRFVLQFRSNASEFERGFAAGLLLLMPDGWWAYFSEEKWYPYTCKNGASAIYQLAGLGAEDPFMQLELEMMIDLSSEVNA